MTDGYEAFRLALQPEPWVQSAACRGLDPNLFQLEQGQSARLPREVCDTCPVTDECLEYGIRTGSVGVWGGKVLDVKKGTNRKVLEFLQDARPTPVAKVVRRSSGSITTVVPVTLAASKHRP